MSIPTVLADTQVYEAWWIQILKAIVIFAVILQILPVVIVIERKLLGRFQMRYGPNRVGPFGLGQVVADMLKIFFKEDWTPPFADKAMFWIAPAIAMAMMMLGFLVIPLTDTIWVGDLDIGLLFFLAIAGLAVYAVILGGWASNSKYALLGGVRSTAQTISYEVFMGLALMGVVAAASVA